MALDYDASILEIIEKPIPQRPKGFGITISEYAHVYHCSTKYARDILTKAVEDGVLQVEEMRNGRICGAVYSKVAKKK